MTRAVELRSDTFTLPTDSMRAAMAAAKVGDDVWDEDPTIGGALDYQGNLVNGPARPLGRNNVVRFGPEFKQYYTNPILAAVINKLYKLASF